MGCDIHFYVEKKVEDAWQAVQGVNRWYGKYEGESKYSYEGWAYSGRNYELFALLADVRNYNDITPISSPKGLPEDVSEVIKEFSDRWEGDGHSHSYFTLSELMENNDKEAGMEISEFFSERTFPLLEQLSEGDPNSVRIVFWFDN